MWFLAKNIMDQIDAARIAGFELSDLNRERLRATSATNGKLSVEGNTAVIPIEGVLTNKRNLFAAWFGGGNTMYRDIIGSIAEANADKRVKQIVLAVGTSPGGNVNGMFQAMDAIRDSAKPIVAHVDNQATSATYGLVSQASEVIAGHRSTQFGSVGVSVDAFVHEDKVSITSTEAPKKRPDLKTDEGKAVIRKELDDVHGLFAASIANGRGITADKVNKNFGQGAIVLADEALKNGMIDSIGTTDQQNKQTAASGWKGKSMDVKTLMLEHPDIYAAVVQIGVDEERDRVTAHLTMGSKSGAMDEAIKAIENGAGMTMSLQAKYMSAAMDKQAMQARIDDNPDAGDLATAETQTAETSFEKQVLTAIDEQLNEVL